MAHLNNIARHQLAIVIFQDNMVEVMPDKVQDTNRLQVNKVGNLLVFFLALKRTFVEANAY